MSLLGDQKKEIKPMRLMSIQKDVEVVKTLKMSASTFECPKSPVEHLKCWWCTVNVAGALLMSGLCSKCQN